MIRLDKGAVVRQASTTGESVEVEPFPLVSALVVARTNGVPLTEADEDTARRAVNQYCNDLKAEAPVAKSRFEDGRWAFNVCITTSG